MLLGAITQPATPLIYSVMLSWLHYSQISSSCLSVTIRKSRESLDRVDITLPGYQESLIKTIVLAAANKPVVLVLMNGGPISLSEWTLQNVHAIVEAFFPGEEGSNAIFDVIFGNYNPAGRLPWTVVKTVNDLPPMANMSMYERTYRYSSKEPQFYFGDGMSYTTFSYSDLQMITVPVIIPCESVVLSVKATNTGDRQGDTTIQVYMSNRSAKVPVPNIALVAFERVSLKPGESQVVVLSIDAEWMSIVTNDGQQIIDADHFEVYVGGNHPQSYMNQQGSLMTLFDVGGRKLLSQCK